jgi:hypothetical protein
MTGSHSAGWPQNSPSPVQLKEFLQQIGSGRINTRMVQRLIEGERTIPREQTLRRIMQKDLIAPREIELTYGLHYSDEERRHFSDTISHALPRKEQVDRGNGP